MHSSLLREIPKSPSRATPKTAAFVLTLVLVLFSASSLPADLLVDAAASQPKITAGSLHSLAIDDGGNVWAFGDNTTANSAMGPLRAEPHRSSPTRPPRPAGRSPSPREIRIPSS